MDNFGKRRSLPFCDSYQRMAPEVDTGICSGFGFSEGDFPVDKSVCYVEASERREGVKVFFSSEEEYGSSMIDRSYPGVSVVPEPTPEDSSRARYLGRIAVYDSAAAAPRINNVNADSADSFIEELAAQTYSVVRELDGNLPYTVIREIVENLIHAHFREPVISVLDGGTTVRFSDQGPGIPDKERAMLPGYTTASVEMKDLIRGVGSGLPLVREFLRHEGGSLALEDNLGSGTVVTLKMTGSVLSPPGEDARNDDSDTELMDGLSLLPRLSTRQKRVLSLVLECGEVGPTLVSKELTVGLSTAYRDLASLEEYGLISSGEAGKRTTTDLGIAYLDSLCG